MTDAPTGSIAPRITTITSNRTIAVLVGLLFLTSTVTFAIGSSPLGAFFTGKSTVMGGTKE